MLLISFYLLSSFGWALTECPSKEVSLPCYCDVDLRDITCKNMTGNQLKTTFDRISNNITFQNFNALKIDLIQSEELPARMTLNLTFLFIEIGFADNSKLIRIYSKAFEGTADQVTMLSVRRSNSNLISSAGAYNVFDMLNSFVNLKDLVFVVPKIFIIPKMAFKSLIKLKFVKFGAADELPMGKFLDRVSVGDDAFYQLKKIQQIDLSSNRINKLSANSLRLQNASTTTTTLYLFLNNNKLNSSSFATNSLAQFNRITRISLLKNQINYLDRNVFQPFLDAHLSNVIDTLAANPLNCSDCRNYWIVKNQRKYKKKVKEAYCDGLVNNVIFNKTFDHCKS